jgi:hypothetical protein
MRYAVDTLGGKAMLSVCLAARQVSQNSEVRKCSVCFLGFTIILVSNTIMEMSWSISHKTSVERE